MYGCRLKRRQLFMSDTTIATLRAMLANLDDAKKYQSLRDVMETLPCRRRRCRCRSACVPRTWQLKFLPS